MKRIIRRTLQKITSLVLSLCMAGTLGVSVPVTVKAADVSDKMISASPDGTENWQDLVIDMGEPENNRWGYWGTPLGNGLFGVKENGGVTDDVFQLTNMTFWSGDPQFRDDTWDGTAGYSNSPEKKREAYQKLRSTLKEAYTEGISQSRRDELMKSIEQTTKDVWSGGYREQANCLAQGQILMHFDGFDEGVYDYKRLLDMNEASSNVKFKKDGTEYYRESFISNPDNVLVTRITNSADDAMGMSVEMALPGQMEGKSKDNAVWADEEKAEIVMTGRAPYMGFGESGNNWEMTWSEDRGTLFEARAKILLPKGGTVKKDGGSLKIEGAKEIILLCADETSYKDSYTDPSNSGVDYAGKVRETLDAAAELGYDALKENHLAEYQPLFRRLWIELGGDSIQMSDGTWVTAEEYAKHYQYGRYVSICCERENSVMPHGLFGLWMSDFTQENNGAYFLNENVEKMAAVNGAGNLSDASDALYNLVSIWANEETGQKTAQDTYGAKGDKAWVVSHSTDIWGQTGMYGEQTNYGSWLAGGIWTLDLLYDKYDYTQDIELLKKYYPLMEGAAEFALSTLMQVDGVNGELKDYLVIAPSGSPEHRYKIGGDWVSFDIGSACDIQIYNNLFHMMEDGAKDLKAHGISYDEELLDRVLAAREKMVPLELFIDEDTGRLREWYNEYEVWDTTHGHASHLLGLFLNHLDINPLDQPEVYEAEQEESLRWRTAAGGEHPDKGTMILRAGDPEFAFSHFNHGIIGTDYRLDTLMKYTPISAGIAEGILDSRFDSLNVLAGLPAAWREGTVKGICGRGGYELGISWKNGELTQCVIDSSTGETPKVLCKGKGVNLAEDDRFTVNLGGRTLEEKRAEAEEKLDGAYTAKSKAVLRRTLAADSEEEISAALLALTPIYMEAVRKKTKIDDRNGKITYIGNWSTWEKEEHSGGTITYGTTAGDAAEFTFYGSGIEVISTVARHIGAVKIEFDGKDQGTVILNEDALGVSSKYGASVYKNTELADGEHTIRLIVAEGGGKTRFDMDALVVYSSVEVSLEAENVIDKITAIGTVSLKSEAAIETARAAYDALTENQKERVMNASVLTEAERRLEELKNEPEPDLNQEAADRVKELIESIGEVSLESEEAITAARAAYNALTDMQKDLVTNVSDLTAAESKYAELKKAAEENPNPNPNPDNNPNPNPNPDNNPNPNPNPDNNPNQNPNPDNNQNPGQNQEDGKKAIPAKNKTYNRGILQYKVTKSADKNGTVTVAKLLKKKSGKIEIPAEVNLDGYTFKVTEISANACKGSNVKTLVIGANVTKIGNKSFYSCKKLKSITFQSKKAPKVGKKAFQGISKKCRVQAPKKISANQWKKLKKAMQKAGAGKQTAYKKSKK